MRYTEFKIDILRQAVLKNLYENRFLEEQDGLSANKIKAIADEFVKLVGTKLKDKKITADSIANILINKDDIKNIFTQAGLGKEVIDKAVARAKQPTSAPASSATTKKDVTKKSTISDKNKTKTAATKPPQIDIEKVKQAIEHLNRNDSPLVQQIKTAIQKELDAGNIDKVVELLKKQKEAVDNSLKECIRLETVNETASGGASGAGSIASVASPMGAVIKRMPPGQSFFAPMQQQIHRKPRKTNKSAKKRKK
jgi:chorismate mutase